MNSRHEHEEHEVHEVHEVHEEGTEFEDISFVIRPTEAFLKTEVDFLLKLHTVSEHCNGHIKAERHIRALRQIYNNWKIAEYPSDKLQDVKESIQKGLQFIALILKAIPSPTEATDHTFFKTTADPKILLNIEQSMRCFESIEKIKTTTDAMEKDLHSKHP